MVRHSAGVAVVVNVKGVRIEVQEVMRDGGLGLDGIDREGAVVLLLPRAVHIYAVTSPANLRKSFEAPSNEAQCCRQIR